MPPGRHLHFAETASTMDTARQEAGDSDFLLVTAESQTRGRGTKGRPWHSPRGNIYMTVAVHRRRLGPERQKLFPLESGLWLWESAALCLPPQNRALLKLKWPNDLLWGQRKVAGTLMESAGNHLLVGIGVNVSEAPEILDGGTPSACLREAGAPEDCGLALAKAFFALAEERLAEDPGDLLRAWREKTLWDAHFLLRDRPDRPRILPVEVNAEGHLRVRFDDGREEFLVSEYLA